MRYKNPPQKLLIQLLCIKFYKCKNTKYKEKRRIVQNTSVENSWFGGIPLLGLHLVHANFCSFIDIKERINNENNKKCVWESTGMNQK